MSDEIELSPSTPPATGRVNGKFGVGHQLSLKRGHRNRLTKAFVEAQAKLGDDGNPLVFLLKCMTDEEQPMTLRVSCADKICKVIFPQAVSLESDEDDSPEDVERIKTSLKLMIAQFSSSR